MKNRFRGLSEKTKAEIMAMSIEEVYQAGFEAGKTSNNQKHDDSLGAFTEAMRHMAKLGKVYLIKSPNQQRAELIQRAREFVEKFEAVRYGDGQIDRTEGNSTAVHHCYETDFFIKGSNVTAVVYWLIGGKSRHYPSKHVGRAKCTPDDVFNADIGKAIALARALEIDVPVEFLQAVQPDEVVVGHKVRKIWGGLITRVTEELEDGETNSVGYVKSQGSDYEIHDDTNAIYSEESK